MATVNMTAETRTETGKGAARKIRKSGLVPAIIYREGNTPTQITLDAKDLELKFQRTGNPNTLVNISVGDVSKVCLVRDVQRHPVSQAIRHLDFFEVKDDEDITVSVPVEAVGRAEGTRMGGKLRIVARYLDVRCKPANIPPTVKVDVTPLNIGQFIRASKIPSPDNTQIIVEQDFNVVTVIGKRGGTKG